MSDTVEIEKKFLVTGDGFKEGADRKVIRQGYIAADKRMNVRVRQKGDKCFLTIKAQRDETSRHEFEYEIPCAHAETMLKQVCEKPPIEKVRYTVDYAGETWEVDVFEGANAGLTVAEIELESADEPFDKPDWIGREVSSEPRYLNARLIEEPFNTWGVSYGDLLES